MNDAPHASRPPASRFTLLLVAVAIAAAAAGIALSRWLSAPPPLPDNMYSTVFPQGRETEAMRLIDHDGQPFTRERLRGKWTLMFFGFTHCPDVCPTALKLMQKIRKERPQDMPLQVVFVSVDPRRDPPARLRDYVRYFDPEFIGVTGKMEDLITFTHSMGVLFAYRDTGAGDGSYSVDHTAQIMLFDPDGLWRAVFSPPHEAGRITQTLKEIRAYVGE